MSSLLAEVPNTDTLQRPPSEIPQTPPSQTPQTPPSQTPPSQTPESKNIDLKKFLEKNFVPECPPCNNATTGRYIYSVFHSIMAIIAIYLSFRCNNGFSLGSFLIACTCPYIYIIYTVATKGTCGILENKKLN